MSSTTKVARSVVEALNLLSEVGASEVYRAQAARARDPETATVLREMLAHEATQACEARARVHSPEPLRRAAEAAFRAGGELLGRVTALGGDRASLCLDYVLERFAEFGYRAELGLLPDDAAPSQRRVLRRALEEERAHQARIRERLGL